MPDRVVDQVPDHPLQQLRVPGRLGRVELRVYPQVQAFDLRRGGVYGVLRPGGQVGELAADRALVAHREGEQRLDHALGPVDRAPHAHGHVLELHHGRGRLGQGHVDRGAHHGQRRTELVRGVGHKAALGGERRVQALQHAVEGVGQLLQLVPGSGQREPLAQVLLGGPAGGLSNHAHGPEHAAGHDPAQAARDDRHDPEPDQGEHQQLVQRALALGLRARAGARAESLQLIARRQQRLGGPRSLGSLLIAYGQQLGLFLAGRSGWHRAAGGQAAGHQAVGEAEQPGPGGEEQHRVQQREPGPDLLRPEPAEPPQRRAQVHGSR